MTDRREIWNDYCKFPNIKEFNFWIKPPKKGRRKKERKKEKGRDWRRKEDENKDERERERKGRDRVRKEGQAMGVIIIMSLIILLDGLNETNPESFLTSDFTDT